MEFITNFFSDIFGNNAGLETAKKALICSQIGIFGFFALYHNVIMAFVIEIEVNIEHKIPTISVTANPLVGPVPNI